MASLTVWEFDTADGADQALQKVTALVKQQLIQVQDAAVVSWPKGKKKPKTHQAASMTGAGALSGAFWGMLFGLLFFIPFLGLAIGAAMGALAGHFTDQATVDKVADAFKGTKMELMQSNLSADQEAALKKAFGDN